MPVVTMVTTFASEETVLLAGKTYPVNKELFQKLVKCDPPACRLATMAEQEKTNRVSPPDAQAPASHPVESGLLGETDDELDDDSDSDIEEDDDK